MLDWLGDTFLIGGFFNVVMIIGLALLVHLQMGLTRVANFGVVGFWGLGIYAYAIAYKEIPWPFDSWAESAVLSWWPFPESWPLDDLLRFFSSALIATIAAGLAGLLVGWLISDLDVDGVLVGTLGFATVVVLLATAMTDITGGATGIGGLRLPFDIGKTDENDFVWLIFTTLVVIGILLYVIWVHRSPYGRLLIAVGVNEPLARSLGKSTTRAKLKMFALTSAGMGLLGAIQVTMARFVVPEDIAITVTLAALAALILGGITRPWGAVVGVLFTVALFDIVVQFYVPLPREWYTQAFPVAREAIFGLALVLVLLFRPKGMLGEMKRPQLMRRIHGND